MIAKTTTIAMVAILLISPLATGGELEQGESHGVKGTVLSVGYPTGDILLSQDEGPVMVFYGVTPEDLRWVGAGDRVEVTYAKNFRILTLRRLDLYSYGGVKTHRKPTSNTPPPK